MPQGKMFSSGTGTAFASTAAAEVIQLSGSASTIGIIHEMRLSQETEFGDAAAEMIVLKCYRTTALGVTGAGTVETISGLIDGDTATSVMKTNPTASTSLTLIWSDVFNVQAGFLYLPTPATQIVIPGVAAEGVVFVVDAPNDEITWTANIVWEEILYT